MPPRNRYFTVEDPEVGLTRSQLKRASRTRQLAYMKHWFETYYEDPAHWMPREDNEFIYIWGGPYDANEELGDEFGGLLSDQRIQEVVDLVQSDGTYDWAPSKRHPAYLAGITQDEPDEEPPESPSETIEDVLDRLRAGDRPFGRTSGILPQVNGGCPLYGTLSECLTSEMGRTAAPQA